MLGVIVTILTVILVFICVLMALVILMQRPKQEGLGAAFGGGLTDRMLGSGTTDFLQKATVFMGVCFFVLSLTIATLMAYDRNAERQSQSDELKRVAAQAEAAEPDTNNALPPAPGAESTTAPPFSVNTPPLTVPELEPEPLQPADLGDGPDASVEIPLDGDDGTISIVPAEDDASPSDATEIPPTDDADNGEPPAPQS